MSSLRSGAKSFLLKSFAFSYYTICSQVANAVANAVSLSFSLKGSVVNFAAYFLGWKKEGTCKSVHFLICKLVLCMQFPTLHVDWDRITFSVIHPGFHKLLNMCQKSPRFWLQPDISHVNGKTAMIYNIQTKYNLNDQYLFLFVK